ncbi:MAG TPA: hypothetical protein VFT74_00710 [Isosphaeraceae bacterium]|nr:hypothetical protein [Isosphaeraceae bacterium]
MNPSRLWVRFLPAVLLLSLTGCGAVRNPNAVYRNGGATPPPQPSVSATSEDLRTPQEILNGEETQLHSQVLPGFAREAVPDRVMLQDQVHAGYNDSPSPVD